MGDAQKPSHVIRIHAAWQRTELYKDLTPIQSCVVSFPDLLPIDPATSFLAYVRKFNSPTGLNDDDRIDLDCSMLVGANFITINGHSIAPVDSPTIDISGLLKRHNELMIQLAVSRIDLARSATARLLIVTS